MGYKKMKKLLLPSSRFARNKGATLIEVLVAIFLLTIGLLAMAALTTSALSYNKLSQIRGTATMLANDYAEQARANLRAFDVDSYSISTTPANAPSPVLPIVSSSYSVPGGLADAKLMARWDKYNWTQNVAARLPAGKAIVATTTAAVGGTAVRMMEIWVQWKEPGTGFDIAPTSDFAKCPSGDADYSCLYFKVAI